MPAPSHGKETAQVCLAYGNNPRFTLSLVANQEARAVARGWVPTWKELTVNGQEGSYWGDRNIQKLIYSYGCSVW